MGNSEDRCGPEVSMWEPRKPQGRYNEVRETNWGKKKKAKGQSQQTPTFQEHKEKEEPQDRSRHLRHRKRTRKGIRPVEDWIAPPWGEARKCCPQGGQVSITVRKLTGYSGEAQVSLFKEKGSKKHCYVSLGAPMPLCTYLLGETFITLCFMSVSLAGEWDWICWYLYLQCLVSAVPATQQKLNKCLEVFWRAIDKYAVVELWKFDTTLNLLLRTYP